MNDGKYLNNATYVHIMKRFVNIGELTLVRHIFIYLNFAAEII